MAYVRGGQVACILRQSARLSSATCPHSPASAVAYFGASDPQPTASRTRPIESRHESFLKKWLIYVGFFWPRCVPAGLERRTGLGRAGRRPSPRAARPPRRHGAGAIGSDLRAFQRIFRAGFYSTSPSSESEPLPPPSPSPAAGASAGAAASGTASYASPPPLCFARCSSNLAFEKAAPSCTRPTKDTLQRQSSRDQLARGEETLVDLEANREKGVE